MERKLSEKASKMRQRLTFSRHRASTLASSANNTPSTPNSRPRSATTPVSSHQPRRGGGGGGGGGDNPPSRYYDFTDEPGYFRPASPLIDRQEIAEELEDDMKHACAMLVHSIERGLPIWPTSSSNLRPNTGSTSVVHAETEIEPETGTAAGAGPDQNQNQVSSASSTVLAGTEIEIEMDDIPEMHDSGVAFSNQSSSSAKAGKTGQNSLSGPGVSASTGRFYGRRLSTSPRDKDALDKSRARGRSFATETSSIRSRSRSSSPVLFPYSPPQADGQWGGEDEDKDRENNNNDNENNLAPADDLLGAEGVTWLRADLDVHRRCEPEHTHPQTQGKAHSQSKNEAETTTPQPRRFYGTRRLPSEKIFRPHEWAYEVASSRGSSLCDASSVRSLAFQDQKQHWADYSRGFNNPNMNSNSNAEAVYSVLAGAQPRHHRRGRATQLLRRLVGIRRKEEEEGGESRRVHRALVAAA